MRPDQRLDAKDDQIKMWRRDADEGRGADLTAKPPARGSARGAAAERGRPPRCNAWRRMSSARSVAEAEVMSARHDAESVEAREDALLECLSCESATTSVRKRGSRRGLLTQVAHEPTSLN